MVHIESRPSKSNPTESEILVDVECDGKRMEQLVSLLRREVAAVNTEETNQPYHPPPGLLSSGPSFGQRSSHKTKPRFFFLHSL